jgi:excinuclease ABC subunit C
MQKYINFQTFPEEPGCYLFKNSSEIILYVGKAKNIKKRVLSYFQDKDHDPKTKILIEQIEFVDYIVTNNEIEALILENNLIKKYSPKYNINLRDSKRYAYIMLTKENFPRLIIARKREFIEAECFGPFTSGEKRDYILETLKRVFKLRTCVKLPKKPCLRYHIGLCDAPCINLISKNDYYEQKIQPIKEILNGKTKELSRKLELKMKKESDFLNFEQAIDLKNQIEALEWLKEKQSVERIKKYNEDIINYVIKDEKVYLMLFNIYKGILENKQEYEFDFSSDFLEQFLIQYYSENEIPKEIILPEKTDEILNAFINDRKQEKGIITVPEKGEKKLLLDLVKKNIEISFFGEEENLKDLKIKLNLQDIPRIIECFDISHLRGTSMTGSMVQFRNGKPDKSNYRRFKIKTVEKIDDFAAIKEIVERRYYRLKFEKKEFPDLIIIDGGKGQLSSAIEVLNKLELKIPMISIAKEFEEIYVPGSINPLILDKKSKALQMIQKIRDEAHRFAISYNRLLRKKSFFGK